MEKLSLGVLSPETSFLDISAEGQEAMEGVGVGDELSLGSTWGKILAFPFTLQSRVWAQQSHHRTGPQGQPELPHGDGEQGGYRTGKQEGSERYETDNGWTTPS